MASKLGVGTAQGSQWVVTGKGSCLAQVPLVLREPTPTAKLRPEPLGIGEDLCTQGKQDFQELSQGF